MNSASESRSRVPSVPFVTSSASSDTSPCAATTSVPNSVQMLGRVASWSIRYRDMLFSRPIPRTSNVTFRA
jgi:hypothetical protein